MNNTVVAYTCLASAMGLIRQASQMAPHLFTDGALEVVMNDLDTEMLELQRLPEWN